MWYINLALYIAAYLLFLGGLMVLTEWIRRSSYTPPSLYPDEDDNCDMDMN